jgi:methylthioribose-1-phosphate isomerase
LLARGYADAIVTGADRIAANGDTANKVGTFSLALSAQYAKVPFVVVAPESTVDVSTRSGADIHIEERSSDEVVSFKGVDVSPAGTKAINPAFDVTPVSLIESLVTDQRVVRFRRGEQIS